MRAIIERGAFLSTCEMKYSPNALPLQRFHQTEVTSNLLNIPHFRHCKTHGSLFRIHRSTRHASIRWRKLNLISEDNLFPLSVTFRNAIQLNSIWHNFILLNFPNSTQLRSIQFHLITSSSTWCGAEPRDVIWFDVIYCYLMLSNAMQNMYSK